jgi:hypothetical protein
MKKKNPLMRARFAVACATILVSATGVKSAAAQTQVVVTNTGAQAVPVYGAVLTTQQADPVQIDLYVGFGPSDVAPKASYDLPAGKRLRSNTSARTASPTTPPIRTLFCGWAPGPTRCLKDSW